MCRWGKNRQTNLGIWRSKDRLIAAPTVSGDAVYILPQPTTTDMPRKQRGRSQVDVHRLQEQVVGGARLPTDKVVYLPSMDHFIYAVDANNGRVLWSVELNGAVAGTPTQQRDAYSLAR